MGDLLGGGGIAGPLPVVVPRGPLTGVSGNPTDEFLRTPATTGNGTTVIGVFPRPGTTFDPSLASAVSRIPQFWRGAFKIGEDESPRPTTRVYTSYYAYDEVFKSFGGPATPRMFVHQEIFGGEYAFLSGWSSVGIRLPYTQFAGGSFYNDTALGDISLIWKSLIYDDPATGSIVSGGLMLTVPTGERPFPSTITGDIVRGTLFQPYLGYIWAGDRSYLQGFSSIIVPTDHRDVTFFANDVQIGYFLIRDRGAAVSGLAPILEMHLNTPVDHRGAQTDPVGFVDQFTMLGGVQFLFRDRAGLAISAGSPLTGPRPFSLQAAVQLNWWF
jgi:hypothetical protein